MLWWCNFLLVSDEATVVSVNMFVRDFIEINDLKMVNIYNSWGLLGVSMSIFNFLGDKLQFSIFRSTNFKLLFAKHGMTNDWVFGGNSHYHIKVTWYTRFSFHFWTFNVLGFALLFCSLVNNLVEQVNSLVCCISIIFSLFLLYRW